MRMNPIRFDYVCLVIRKPKVYYIKVIDKIEE